MTDQDMRGFHPFRTMTSYIIPGHTKLLCSMEEVPAQVAALGYKDCDPLPTANQSPPEHGSMREDQKERVRGVFAEDHWLWQRHCGADRSGGDRK